VSGLIIFTSKVDVVISLISFSLMAKLGVVLNRSSSIKDN